MNDPLDETNHATRTNKYGEHWHWASEIAPDGDGHWTRFRATGTCTLEQLNTEAPLSFLNDDKDN